jgi:uncharacterized membrane protein
MKDKLKALFDSPATWSMFGAFAGTVLGAKAQAVISGLGAVVMAII